MSKIVKIVKVAKNKPAGADYEKLGRAMERILVSEYIDLLGSTKRQLWSSFVRGIFTGLGTVLGATVVVAILLFFLHQLGGLPVIGDYLQGVGDTIRR